MMVHMTLCPGGPFQLASSVATVSSGRDSGKWPLTLSYGAAEHEE